MLLRKSINNCSKKVTFTVRAVESRNAPCLPVQYPPNPSHLRTILYYALDVYNIMSWHGFNYLILLTHIQCWISKDSLKTRTIYCSISVVWAFIKRNTCGRLKLGRLVPRLTQHPSTSPTLAQSHIITEMVNHLIILKFYM